ncbi:Crp/Fnr family transcriptional regulator [Actinomadura mexicana]|uniref:cAMP-binding domain of CRP or a regulatory subunit of cAMP-dependent protein kinases n=1 Tax=Actinomadura mexicana TaxID=134959 RepID=A0A239HDU1_9ACTN|nr:Crp/Fnr family transcriptional regulator [Actinomadura mexicana]SNS79567.1 cAMP-binding domain of CRP or a regulatory subunit of cAMP-dependent protein kinases [Actinomadura mexicana]
MTKLEPGSFLAELTTVERDDLTARGRERRYERGELLCMEGESSTAVAVLLEGRVKAYSFIEQGGQVLLAVRGPGALIGEVAAIDEKPHSASVAALETARAIILSRASFMDFLQANGRVSVVILRTLCRLWREADSQRVELGRFDATSRVAARLVELAERFGAPYEDPTAMKSDGIRITLNLSQEELAGWVGASREAVSKALSTLRRHGWIETGRRRVIVYDLQALRDQTRSENTGIYLADT